VSHGDDHWDYRPNLAVRLWRRELPGNRKQRHLTDRLPASKGSSQVVNRVVWNVRAFEQGRLYLSKISKCLSELGSPRMSRFVSEHMKSMSGRGTPLTISNFRGEKEERTKWQAIG
jgi:hypothetical protein